MIGLYLKGSIPDALSLSAYEFGLLYNIPDNMIQARIKDGLVSGILQDGDLVKTLEAERLKILSTSLYRIGNSDHELNRLLAYLGSRVLSGRGSSPDLIKELNTTIGTQVRLTETSFKAITLLNQALATAVQEDANGPIEDHLTRDQILVEFENMKLTGDADKYLEGTPNLEPHNLGMKRKEKLSLAAAHEFNKADEVEPIAIPADITVSPR